MRNLIFKTLYYKEHARSQIDAGVSCKQFKNPEDVYYEDCLFDIHRVESCTADLDFLNHAVITMYSGDTWVIKISRKDYFRLIDHISADKLLCKMKN